MLVNPLYAGFLKYQSKIKTNNKWVSQKNYKTYKGIHTPIVSKKIFEQAQERVKELVPNRSNEISIFKGLLYCPCGKKLSYKKYNSIYKGKYYKGEYYLCKEYSEICLKSYIKEEHIYNLVISDITKNIKEIDIESKEINQDLVIIKENLKFYEKESKKISKQIETLTRNLLNEIIDQILFEKLIKELKERKEFFEKKILSLKNQISNNNLKSDNKKILENFLKKISEEKDSEKLNTFFKLIIEKIVFINEFRLIIYFKF